MYYGDRNGAVPCSNHVSLRHYQPSVCNAGYYFLQSLQILMHLNGEIWEHFVYLSNNYVFSEGPEEITELSFYDLFHALQQSLLYFNETN